MTKQSLMGRSGVFGETRFCQTNPPMWLIIKEGAANKLPGESNRVKAGPVIFLSAWAGGTFEVGFASFLFVEDADVGLGVEQILGALEGAFGGHGGVDLAGKDVVFADALSKAAVAQDAEDVATAPA